MKMVNARIKPSRLTASRSDGSWSTLPSPSNSRPESEPIGTAPSTGPDWRPSAPWLASDSCMILDRWRFAGELLHDSVGRQTRLDGESAAAFRAMENLAALAISDSNSAMTIWAGDQWHGKYTSASGGNGSNSTAAESATQAAGPNAEAPTSRSSAHLPQHCGIFEKSLCGISIFARFAAGLQADKSP
jgi:hypothetical protein